MNQKQFKYDVNDVLMFAIQRFMLQKVKYIVPLPKNHPEVCSFE